MQTLTVLGQIPVLLLLVLGAIHARLKSWPPASAPPAPAPHESAGRRGYCCKI